MRWSSHRSIYQWIDSPISSRATSESASMTFILNAMIYSLSSLYSSVNLIIRSHATSEPATMTLRQCNDLSSHRSTHQWTWSYIHMQLVSLLQWHLSSMQWSIYSHRSIYQWINPLTRSHATSESASMILLPCIVSLLQ